MSTEKIRVGIIGIGTWAFLQHVPNLRKTGKAEVVAISRRNAKALADAQKVLEVAEAHTDWREMLDRSQLDAVVVSTPHDAHAEPTIAALDRGLHVLVEKPMALTSEQAWEMVEAAERAGRTLMVGFNFRVQGCWRTVKKMLEDGILGAIRQLNIVFTTNFRFFWDAEIWPSGVSDLVAAAGFPQGFFDETPVEHWRRDPEKMGGGVFVGPASHVWDLALWLGVARQRLVWHRPAGLRSSHVVRGVVCGHQRRGICWAGLVERFATEHTYAHH